MTVVKSLPCLPPTLSEQERRSRWPVEERRSCWPEERRSPAEQTRRRRTPEQEEWIRNRRRFGRASRAG